LGGGIEVTKMNWYQTHDCYLGDNCSVESYNICQVESLRKEIHELKKEIAEYEEKHIGWAALEMSLKELLKECDEVIKVWPRIYDEADLSLLRNRIREAIK
jgi:ribosomal 50S subunit-associated protein YjgA (DUF615 family)